MTMPRFEHKYRIDNELATDIEHIARFHAAPDEHSLDGSYTVNSLYFDTPEDEDAHETDEGIALRSKVRLRCYSEHPRPPFFLELKQRFGSSIYKTRAALEPEDAERLADGLPPAVTYRRTSGGKALDTIREVMDRRRMSPRVWVKYSRRAWTSPWGDGARMTVDHSIETQALEHCATFGLGPGGWVFAEPDTRPVLELKFFGAAPRWMQRIAHDFQLQRTSCSKYGMSLFSLERSPRTSSWARAS